MTIGTNSPHTLAESIEKHAETRPNKQALIDLDGNRSWTYAEFEDTIATVAGALSEAGVSKGDQLAMVLHNTPEFVLTLYASHWLGANVVPLSPDLTAKDYAYYIDDMDATAVVSAGDVSEIVHQGIEQVGGVAVEVVNGNDAGDHSVSFQSLMEKDDDTAIPRAEMAADDPKYMLYTSGTTGDPKGVQFNSNTARFRALEYPLNADLDEQTVVFQFTPWHHAGGVDGAIQPTLYIGGTVIAKTDPGIEEGLSIIDEYDVTYTISVPYHVKHALDLIEAGEIDPSVSTIDVWLCMGAPLSTELVNRMRKSLTPNVYNAYGTTETCGDTLNRPENLPEKTGTIGTVTAMKQLRLVPLENTDGFNPEETVERGERGEIIVKGPAIADEYFKRPEKTEEAFHDGWFYTNDVGVMDEDGFITHEGRSDDVIVSGGDNIAAVAVEEALEEHASVTAAGVVGTPDDELGHRVVAFVVVSDDVSEEDLDSHMIETDSLADFKRPREYHFVNELPRTTTEKKRRHVLRDKVA